MIFDFSTYQSYLEAELDPKHHGRGKRAEIARVLNCQTSFVSHVLTGRAHLSLEHAINLSEHYHHSPLEQKYFLLLVQKAKSGTRQLEIFFQRQIDEIQISRQSIVERIQIIDQLGPADQSIYYSTWWHLAIHILVAFPDCNTLEQIGLRLSLKKEVIESSLQFLVSRGLVIEKRTGFTIGKTRIHLGAQSDLAVRHHSNWRTKAIDVIERSDSKSLHYSGLIGVSRKDAERIRFLILKFLEETEEVIKLSSEEAPYMMNIDFAEF